MGRIRKRGNRLVVVSGLVGLSGCVQPHLPLPPPPPPQVVMEPQFILNTPDDVNEAIVKANGLPIAEIHPTSENIVYVISGLSCLNGYPSFYLVEENGANIEINREIDRRIMKYNIALLDSARIYASYNCEIAPVYMEN